MGLKGWLGRKLEEIDLAKRTHFAEEKMAYEEELRRLSKKRGREKAQKKMGLKKSAKRVLFQPDYDAIDRALYGSFIPSRRIKRKRRR